MISLSVLEKTSEFCKTNLWMHDVKSYEIESSSMPRWETNEVFFFIGKTACGALLN